MYRGVVHFIVIKVFPDSTLVGLPGAPGTSAASILIDSDAAD